MMFMINWIKNRNFYLLLGLLIVIYIFYVRMILVRLPKELYLWDEDCFHINMCLMAFIWITLSIYFIVISISKLFLFEIKFNKMKDILIKIQDIIEKSLYEVYRWPERFMDNGYDAISKITSKFYSFWGKRDERIFVFIPYVIRIIILFAFLFDVLITFKLDYFYKCLILLCISIGINILFFVLKDFSGNLDDVENTLIIKYLGVDDETKLPIHNYSPAPGYEDINLNYHTMQYILLSKLKGYLELYLALQNYYSPRVNLFIYSLYLIGWLFIISKNIYLFI